MPKQLIYSLVGQRRVVSAQVGVIFAQSCESAACDQWRIVADRLPKGSTKLAKLMAEAEEDVFTHMRFQRNTGPEISGSAVAIRSPLFGNSGTRSSTCTERTVPRRCRSSEGRF